MTFPPGPNDQQPSQSQDPQNRDQPQHADQQVAGAWPPPTPPKRPAGLIWGIAAACAVLLLVVAGVVATRILNRDQPAATPATPPTGTPTTPDETPTANPAALGDTAKNAAYASYYQQKLSWSGCSGIECAKVKVPLDWTDPAGASVEVRIARVKAAGKAIGSIVYDPGGPGASGADFVAQSQVVSDAVAKQYNVIGIDPRGVGKSQPAIKCLDDAGMDQWLSADTMPWTPEGFQAQLGLAKNFAAACQKNTGPLLAHVDTYSAARDMDVIRAALGEPKLNYLGQSYGTLLGATYAGFYPQYAGRMVLDGALDPASDSTAMAVIQAKGFEEELRSYVATCLKGDTGDCPFSGSVDQGLAQLSAMVQKVHDKPVKSGNRTLTAPLAVSGIITPMYDPLNWFYLSQALNELKVGNATTLLRLADAYADRDSNGRYSSNIMPAFQSIGCLDYPPLKTEAEMNAQSKKVLAVAPTLGKYFSYSDLVCSVWPYAPVRKPAPIHAAGSGPILVVGTTGDPATPYPWAVSLAKELDKGTLLTYQGNGHTAYNRASNCIDEKVDTYFLKGTPPAEGTRCS